ncbi:MAG: hypothetical protein K5930_13650 [Treponemataceae bacterium]|nr:hypothetical protein [Treponemataceae bacterium]
MKNYKSILLILLPAISFLMFFSCRQDVIFYDIAQEIQYEEPIVEGSIFSMVPCNGLLFVQNNMIYKKAWNAKKDEAGRWEKTSSPVESKIVIRLASDASYLYALVKDSAADSTGTVYAAQVTSSGTGDWQQVADNVKELYDNRVFAADGSTTGRNAYLTGSDYSVKKLAGSSAPVAQTVTDVIAEPLASPYIKAAASDGSTDYFSSNDVFAVKVVGGATYFYTFNDTIIKYKAATALPEAAWTDGGSTQSIITTLTSNGASELLVGTQAGYEISTIDSTGKPGNGVTPEGNAESAFGTRYVTGIWHYGEEGTLYAAVIGIEHSQYNKLWGYYASRNSWNYE